MRVAHWAASALLITLFASDAHGLQVQADVSVDGKKKTDKNRSRFILDDDDNEVLEKVKLMDRNRFKSDPKEAKSLERAIMSDIGTS